MSRSQTLFAIEKLIVFLRASLAATILTAVLWGFLAILLTAGLGTIFILAAMIPMILISVPGGLFAGVLFLVVMKSAIPRRYLNSFTAGIVGLLVCVLWYTLVPYLAKCFQPMSGWKNEFMWAIFMSFEPIWESEGNILIWAIVGTHAIFTSVLIYRWVLLVDTESQIV